MSLNLCIIFCNNVNNDSLFKMMIKNRNLNLTAAVEYFTLLNVFYATGCVASFRFTMNPRYHLIPKFRIVNEKQCFGNNQFA